MIPAVIVPADKLPPGVRLTFEVLTLFHFSQFNGSHGVPLLESPIKVYLRQTFICEGDDRAGC